MRCDECKWGQFYPAKEIPERTDVSWTHRWWWFARKTTGLYPAHTIPEYVVCHRFFPHLRGCWNHDGPEVAPDWFCPKWEPS
jgi:hypothetical protein